MNEFIEYGEAVEILEEDLREALELCKAAKEFIDCHVLSHDHTGKAVEKYRLYREALSNIGYTDEAWEEI